MADCPPIRIAAAVAAELNAAVAADTFATPFDAVFSFADAITDMADVNETAGLLVDVLPAQNPNWAQAGRGMHRHAVKVKIGLRRRLLPEDRNADGTVQTEILAAYCNLLYDILELFAPSPSSPNGRALSTVSDACWDPGTPPVLMLYDEARLKQGLYLGWIHLPFLYHERIS